LRQVVEIAREILIGDGELAGGVQAEERRVGLDGQLIEREVLGRFREPADDVELLVEQAADAAERVLGDAPDPT